MNTEQIITQPVGSLGEAQQEAFCSDPNCVLNCKEETGDDEGHYETNSQSCWHNCKKNPGHPDFISDTTFSLNHLPPICQSSEIFEVIKALAYLVVKVIISRTSTSRPKWDREKRPYPSYINKGLRRQRTGSGRVWDVHKYTEEDDRPCECRDCKRSSTPKKSWGEVNIVTAQHVVFDNLEGQFTRCLWNYNHDKSNYVTLEGIGVGTTDFDRDLSYVRCVTHNLSLIDKLKRGLSKYSELCEKVYQNHKPLVTSAKLIAIVSHPHGWFKQISIGECNATDPAPCGGSRYIYTTCTCPGSSGAPVYNLGQDKVRWSSNLHSGADEPLKINQSGSDESLKVSRSGISWM